MGFEEIGAVEHVGAEFGLVEFGLPQAERGACISSPILPAVGVPGASTRAVDQTRITGLSIGATAGVGTYQRLALYGSRLLDTQITALSSTGSPLVASAVAHVAALGGAGEALWLPETSLSLAELNARAIWGAIAAPGEEALATRDSPVGTSRSFRITERV